MTLNNTQKIKRDILVKIIRRYLDGTLLDTIDRIPIEMRPKEHSDATRCCIYRDRAIIKYRIMAALGMRSEDEIDELKQLRQYATEALSSDNPECKSLLTIVAEACSACTSKRHEVTNACRGCAARPCQTSCPKSAISIINGQAKIDMEKCINCGICVQHCRFSAIIKVVPPCEDVCPTAAIGKHSSNKAEIKERECILCGKCINICPFSAVMEVSEILPVLKKIKEKQHVTAIVAPALFGQFSQAPEQVMAAIKKAGFDKVLEAAEGAMKTIKNEAGELEQHIQDSDKFMTTSCCPSYVEFVKRHNPGILDQVSRTPSPMIYSGTQAKTENPSTTTVFVGPCLAKRYEAQHSHVIDHVLNFEELTALWIALDINIDDCKPLELNPVSSDSRKFPLSGGVAQAVANECLNKDLKSHCINGISSKRQILKELKDNSDCNIIEVMACEDGCVGGPSTFAPTKKAKVRIEKHNKKKD